MSVPAANKAKHTVNYLAKLNSHFQPAVIALLIAILIAVLALHARSTHQDQRVLRQFMDIHRKMAQAELQPNEDDIGKSDYVKFQQSHMKDKLQSRLMEKIRNLQKKLERIELISQKTMREVEQAIEIIKAGQEKSEGKKLIDYLEQIKLEILQILRPLTKFTSYFT